MNCNDIGRPPRRRARARKPSAHPENSRDGTPYSRARHSARCDLATFEEARSARTSLCDEKGGGEAGPPGRPADCARDQEPNRSARRTPIASSDCRDDTFIGLGRLGLAARRGPRHGAAASLNPGALEHARWLLRHRIEDTTKNRKGYGRRSERRTHRRGSRTCRGCEAALGRT